MNAVETILALPLIGILRGFNMDRLEPIVAAFLAGGLKNLEITMNTRGAEDQIRAANQFGAGRLNVGAGTVTSPEVLERAIGAGANFIVTPSFDRKVIELSVRKGIPVFPGAFTPTEIYGAWELGASMVKIFPAELGGPGFVKSLKGPFPNLKLLPTGGVDLETLPAFVQAGADGFGVGSPLFNKERIQAGDWQWLELRCRAFVEAYTAACTSHGSASRFAR